MDDLDATLAAINALTVSELFELAGKTDFEDKIDFGKTPLHVAARNGLIDGVKAFNKSEISMRDLFGKTPLHVAAENGHTDGVKVLLEAEADYGVKDNYGKTPLHLAAENGHADVVKALIEAGANANVTDKDGKIPLFRAAVEGHTDAIKVLTQVLPDVNAKVGQAPLIMHALRMSRVEFVKVLIQAGADVNAKDEYENTTLHMAVRNDRIDVVKALIEAEADVDVEDDHGRTPLHWAAAKGHIDIVKALVEAEADVHAKDEFGSTSLSWAIRNGHLDVVNILNEKHKCSNIHLLLAVLRGSIDLSKSMIKRVVLDKHSNVVWDLINNNSELLEFWSDCKNQVERMKKTMPGNSTISLYKFLQEADENKLVDYLSENPDLKELERGQYAESFPAYALMIAAKLDRVNRRECLLYRSKIVAKHSDLKILPAKITNKILNYMTNVDLKSFILAACWPTGNNPNA